MLNVIDLPAHPPFRPDGSLNIEQLEHEYTWGRPPFRRPDGSLDIEQLEHEYTENGWGHVYSTGNKHIQVSFGEYAAAVAAEAALDFHYAIYH